MTAVGFGIATAPQQVDYPDIARVWNEADGVPEIEHAWLFDHLLPIAGDRSGPIFEGWTLLSALAARTGCGPRTSICCDHDRATPGARPTGALSALGWGVGRSLI